MNVTLFADRLGRSSPTGIGLYIARMIEYLPKIAPRMQFVATTWQEKSDFAGVRRANIRFRQVPGPRPLNVLLGMIGLSGEQGIDSDSDVFHALVPVPFVRKRASLVTVHDLTPISHKKYYKPAERLVFKAAMHQAITRATHFIANSHQTANDLRHMFDIPAQRISVVYLGLDKDVPEIDMTRLAALRCRYDLHAPYILFVGTINARKNLCVLVKAFATLANEFPDLVLALVGGEGLGADAVKATVRTYGLERRVRLTGYLPREDMLGLLKMANVFAFPSVYEGFGWPPLEAMTQGVPVVAARGGSIPEIVGDAALLSAPDNIEDLAIHLRAALTNEDLIGALRERGQKRIAQFSWEKMALDTINVYRQVLRMD